MFCGNNGWGGSSALWIIILIIILFGWGGNEEKTPLRRSHCGPGSAVCGGGHWRVYPAGLRGLDRRRRCAGPEQGGEVHHLYSS